jgi:hypothetical protein
MLSSFATFAASLWLGLVTVAFVLWLWRATAHQGSGFSSRDHLRATGGENYRRHRDFSSEGPNSVARRSLVSISCAILKAIQTGLSRAFRWLSKVFRSSGPSQDSVSRLSPIAVQASNSPSGSQLSPQSDESVVSLPAKKSAGATQRTRARRAVKKTQEPRRKSAEPRSGKNESQPMEKVAKTASKLRKDHSEKRSQKMNMEVANTGRKTTRTKRKISPASNPSLPPKVSV